jgi:hypothetical protein
MAIQDKRNCYFEGEYELKYYNYYTSWNCFDECIANLTYEQCNCVRYYMPRKDKMIDSIVKVPIFRGSSMIDLLLYFHARRRQTRNMWTCKLFLC